MNHFQKLYNINVIASTLKQSNTHADTLSKNTSRTQPPANAHISARINVAESGQRDIYEIKLYMQSGRKKSQRARNRKATGVRIIVIGADIVKQFNINVRVVVVVVVVSIGADCDAGDAAAAVLLHAAETAQYHALQRTIELRRAIIYIRRADLENLSVTDVSDFAFYRNV